MKVSELIAIMLRCIANFAVLRWILLVSVTRFGGNFECSISNKGDFQNSSFDVGVLVNKESILCKQTFWTGVLTNR